MSNIETDQPKGKINRAIAYYADEILDVWLNIGKHDPDDPEPVIEWGSYRTK